MTVEEEFIEFELIVLSQVALLLNPTAARIAEATGYEIGHVREVLRALERRGVIERALRSGSPEKTNSLVDH